MKYPYKESSVLEFKREVPQKKQTLLKTVIGFANMYGGQIIIGVDDSREIIGISEQDIDSIVDDLNRSIYDSVRPNIFPSIYTQRFEEKLVIIVDIAEGMNKPYHFHAKRMHDGTYVRMGTHTMQASNEIIHQLQWENQRKHLDEMPVLTAKQSDIDISAFKKFLKERKQADVKVNSDDMLFHYQILTKDRGEIYPTVGGILLFGKNPQKFYPEAFFICSHFAGMSGRDVVATIDCSGSLFQQYQDTVNFILSRLNRSFTISGVESRDEHWEIPIESIREIAINAVVHRNYQINSPSKILIYDDRIEFVSPGNFPGPILIDHVDIGVSYIRNSVITRVFRDIGIVEKLGSGFITVFKAYAQRNLPRPVVQEGAGFVKCILPRPTTRTASVEKKDFESISALFYSRQEISVQDVMSYLSISRATASRLLSSLTDQGCLQRKGKGPSTKYTKK